MMERLTEKLPDGRNIIRGHHDEIFNSKYGHFIAGEAVDKLAEHEDAEEQGLLLRLPYPLGTEYIYYADEKDMDVYKLDAEKIEVHMMPISKKVMYTIDCFDFFIEDFGKIVFLTEKEAEAALAEMRSTEATHMSR